MLINEMDNVEVNILNGHKYAVCDIQKGENIIKYGHPIGHAVCGIKKGEHVHTHNMATNLSEKITYTYEPAGNFCKTTKSELTFMGYRRKNGGVGIRNDIWIVNTVGCVNKTAQILAEKTGAKYFSHPYGCSQLGGDMEITQKILCGMVKHPNAGGVLVLGLGCENNNINVFKKALGSVDEERVKFLNARDCDDEICEGIRLINELKENADKDRRELVNISELKVGLKCGGSDGLSGITANPLVGRFCTRHALAGGSCVMTEVPEMFGAEHILMQRCVNEEIFNKTVRLINNFKDYYISHGCVIYENPSPGNKKGGITTLEEKSLGCVQKGGNAPVTDVLDYGDRAVKPGLSLLNGPGNDMVSSTNLMASGVHMILFTTGRGTPFGSAVPTVKIASNHDLAVKKSGWIDFDASPMLDGIDMTDELLSFVIEVANGKKTKNEENGYEEIAIFKDGVTL